MKNISRFYFIIVYIITIIVVTDDYDIEKRKEICKLHFNDKYEECLKNLQIIHVEPDHGIWK